MCIVAGNDRVISPQLEAMEAKRMNATTTTVPAARLVMLGQPRVVADFIAEAATKLGRE